jgi:uncharacterized protein (TIGR00251 family)
MKLGVKVVPGASKDAVVGWLGDELKVRVSAPPEKGKANRAVEKLLASSFGLNAREVSVINGHGSAHKIVELAGLSRSEILAMLVHAD